MNSTSCPVGNVCFNTNTFVFVVLGLLVVLVIAYQKIIKIIEEKTMYKALLESSQNNKVEYNPKIHRNESIYRKRLEDPLEEPSQSYEFTQNVYRNVNEYQPKKPIHIPTRGMPTDFQPLGILTNVDKQTHHNVPNILQLYGRPLWIGSNKWQYYTSTDGYQSIKVEVMNKNQQCLSETGCEELYTGDEVFIPAYSMKFRVELYKIDKPRYIPYLI